MLLLKLGGGNKGGEGVLAQVGKTAGTLTLYRLEITS